jgi:ankyrin repeat protein
MQQFDERVYLKTTSYSELKKLLEEKKDPNSNNNGFNALHQAGNFPQSIIKIRIELLLKYDINLNSQDCNSTYKNTPLHTFLANENIEIVEYLIATAASYNRQIDYQIADSEGKTPLILATKMRHEGMASLILKEMQLQVKKGIKINIDHQDNNDMTALHYACILGEFNLVKALISMGANVNSINNKKKTPLDCVFTSDEEIKDILDSVSVDSSRDINATSNAFRDHNHQPIFLLFVEPAVSVRECKLVNSKANSELLRAIVKRGILNTDSLFNSKVEEATDEIKKYVLQQLDKLAGESILDGSKKHRNDVMGYLVEKGANYSWLIRHFSATANTEKLKFLLAQSDIKKFINTAGSPSGKTALHQAALNGHQDVCELLLSKGAEINILDADKNTPLHLAVSVKDKIEQRKEVILGLVENGASVAIENKHNKTVINLLDEANQITLKNEVLKVIDELRTRSLYVAKRNEG